MIIKCPECGREISDKATSCPNCGCPQTAWAKQNNSSADPSSNDQANIQSLDSPIKNTFAGVARYGESRPCYLKCVQCEWENYIGFDGIEYDGFRCRPKSDGVCQGCGQKYSKDDVFPILSAANSPLRSTQAPDTNKRRCPRCGGEMTVQTVAENDPAGCGTIFLYILLAITVIGLLVLIPLILQKKTITRTYAVCTRCGNKTLIG